MASTRLSRSDRAFFGDVARAIFTNPFSEERETIYTVLAAREGPVVGTEEPVNRLVRTVRARLETLEASGGANLARCAPEDREVLSLAILFDVYYRFTEFFDALIVEQVAAGDSPVPVPFAREALAMLEARGFDPVQAEQRFALFYQIRRAYYFIDHSLVGASPCMRELRRDLWNSTFTQDIQWYESYLWNRMEDFSTLLLGETGTGKGSAAAAIGRSGFIPFDRKTLTFKESFTRAFVSLNLSEFPEALIESELFGHRKGAFTGAVESHEGVLSRCSPHGSILLDEIGEISVPVQIKLLKVIQERTFTPVGSHETKRFRGRIIAATNRDVEDLRRRGDFRDDFFYRLSSDVIVVPPLRQRLDENPEELDLLVAHAVRRILGDAVEHATAFVKGRIDAQIGPGYAWPGNVRELEQCVRRMLLRGSYEVHRRAEGRDEPSELFRAMAAGQADAREVLAGYCAFLYERLGSYEQVARRTRLDRRTVKKYVEHGAPSPPGTKSDRS